MLEKSVTIELPFVFPTPNNRSGRWKTKQLAKKAERYIFNWMMENGRPKSDEYRVSFTRMSKIASDKDNVAASCKKLQDILHRYAIIPDDKAKDEGGRVEFIYIGKRGHPAKTIVTIEY